MLATMTKKRPGKRAHLSGDPNNGSREDDVNINVWVPRSLRERLDRVIDKAGSNLKQQIIRALRHYLPVAEKRLEEEEGPAS